MLNVISRTLKNLRSKQVTLSYKLSSFKVLKDYSAPGFVLALLEKSKRATQNGEVFREILVNLSIAFVCVPHYLAVAS